MTNKSRGNENEKVSSTTKLAILILVFFTIYSLFPDFKRIKKIITPTGKLYMLSLVNNPEAFYMSSEYWETKNKKENALRDMRLAIGLLELHNSNQIVVERYRKRLKYLQHKFMHLNC
jgi:hypothetical protein